MLRIGIAGIGFMGWIHWLAYQKIEGVQVVAICDQNRVRLSGDWRGIQGNFGPPGEQVDLSNVDAYDNLESLCRADLDVVDICLPPNLHVPAIGLAARQGKHVFCEKPLSLSTSACDLAVQACDRAGRMLMVGHVLPFFPEFAAALEIIESGEFGKPLGGYFKRVISDPSWLPDFYDPEKIGGPLFDLHVHDAHFIRLIAGQPIRVFSSGRCRGSVVKFCHSVFQFDDPDIAMAASSGVIDQAGRPFTHGFEIHLERATIQFEYASLDSGDELMPLKIISSDGVVRRIPLAKLDPLSAFCDEIAEMVACVRTGKTSRILSGHLARDAVNICEAESKSVFTRQPVAID